MEDTNSLTTIYLAGNQIEAEIIKSRLESMSIPVLLKYESLGHVYGLTIDGLAQVQIQVPSEYAEDAEKLLNDSSCDQDVDQTSSSDD